MKIIMNHFSFLCLVLLLFACGGESKTNTPTTTSEPQKKETPSKPKNQTTTQNILFFGNSLTAAYNLDIDDGFVSIIQNRMDSLGLNYKAINAGLSGETSAGGKSRIDWIIDRKAPDVFVLELGANDGLRGLNLQATKENLQAIIDKVVAKNPKVKLVIAGMEAPPNMGKAFTTEFRSIFPALAKKNDAALIPFLLEDVGGIPALNLPDGIHPNVAGQKIVAENVWEVLKEVL
ncbi:MAG: arylesterase [Saprospiraceae bacterium]